MNPYTYFKFNFTFDVWLNIPGATEGTFTETFYKSYSGLLVPGTAQTYLYTKDEMLFNAIVKNMKDAKGQHVFYEFGDDVNRYIAASEPVFDYQGILAGHRSVLRRNPQ